MEHMSVIYMWAAIPFIEGRSNYTEHKNVWYCIMQMSMQMYKFMV